MIDEIQKILSDDYGISRKQLSGTALIEEDLGITGDDAWELMEHLEEKYKIDLSEFEFSLHFSPEAGSYVSKEFGYYPVSIHHLVDIVNLKKWKLPVKNEKNYIKQKRRRKIYKIILFVIIAVLVINYA